MVKTERLVGRAKLYLIWADSRARGNGPAPAPDRDEKCPSSDSRPAPALSQNGRILVRDSKVCFPNARKVLTDVHKWTGLATFLLLLIVAITGCVLTFRAPLDAILNPDLFRAPVSPRPLPVVT